MGNMVNVFHLLLGQPSRSDTLVTSARYLPTKSFHYPFNGIYFGFLEPTDFSIISP
jgi:hypothetical protein